MNAAMPFLSAVDRLLERRDPRVRLRAALKVSRHGARGTLKPVLRRLEMECHPAVIAALLIALAKLGSAKHVVLVSSYLGHRDHRVMRAAALALYRLGRADALPLLVGLLGRQDERVVKQALVALLRTDARTLFAHVRTLLKSPLEPARALGRACREWLCAEEVRALAGMEAAELASHHEALAAALAARAEPVAARPVVAPVKNRFHAAGPRALVGFALVAVLGSFTMRGESGATNVDFMVHAQDAAEQRAAVAPVAPVRRGAAPEGLANRIDQLRQTALALRPQPFRLTADVIARRSTERLAADGITAPAYVELRARAAVSDAAAMQLLARVQAAEDRHDVPVALALLDEALGGLHPKDLERRMQLNRQKRWLLQRQQRYAEAHVVLIAETRAAAAITAILEATVDRSGQPLARRGAAAAVQERVRQLEAMSPAEVLEHSPVVPDARLNV